MKLLALCVPACRMGFHRLLWLVWTASGKHQSQRSHIASEDPQVSSEIDKWFASTASQCTSTIAIQVHMFHLAEEVSFC